MGRHRGRDAGPLADPRKTPVAGLYVNCGWGTGGFKTTPGDGHLLAWTIAGEAPHPINAPFTNELFTTGRLIEQAAAVAH